MTVDRIITQIRATAAGRTRSEGQELGWDEILVGEIERLRADLAATSDALVKADDDRIEVIAANARWAQKCKAQHEELEQIRGKLVVLLSYISELNTQGVPP